ncbi:MAG: SCO family protein [Hyphomicrobiaceae bacterium]
MHVKLALVALLAFLAGGIGAIVAFPERFHRLVEETAEAPIGEAAIGGPFSLVDHRGARVTDKDFGGRYTLFYFGYTHCPDICPAGLQTIEAALAAIGTQADKVTPVLISVDPARDTPEVLADYVRNFGSRMIGLTGTQGEVEQAMRSFRVYARRVEGEGSSDDYLIDHSGYIYLMGPDGRLVSHYSHSISANELARRLRAVL